MEGMLLWLLIGPANAWTLSGSSPAMRTPFWPTDAATWDGDLAVVGPEGAQISAWVSGEAGGLAAVAHDADGDGDRDLILCGPDGLWAVDRLALDAPWQLDAEPCTAVVEHTLDGTSGIATAGERVVLWWDGPAGLDGPEATGIELTAPVLAAGDGGLAAAEDGGSLVFSLEGGAWRSYGVWGHVAALAWSDDGWIAASAAPDRLTTAASQSLLPDAPMDMVSGDVDGDGTLEVFVATTGPLLLYAASGDQRWEDLRADALALGDWNDDGCPEPIDLDRTSFTPFVVEGCPLAEDADGDGFSRHHDCDDADPAVHPYAAEACNGRDDDCDGLLEPSGTPVASPPGLVNEGEAFTIEGALDGCDLGVTLSWEVTGAATCTETGAQLDCTALDDGVLTATLTATGPEGQSATSTSVHVLNVDPVVRLESSASVDVDDSGEIVIVRVAPGVRPQLRWVADDVEDDTIGFASTPSSWLTIDRDGAAQVTGEIGSDDITVVAYDEDGGEGRRTFRFESAGVREEVSAGCGCRGGGAASLLWLLVPLRRRRAPRQVDLRIAPAIGRR
jgi:hypothetical protein